MTSNTSRKNILQITYTVPCTKSYNKYPIKHISIAEKTFVDSKDLNKKVVYDTWAGGLIINNLDKLDSELNLHSGWRMSRQHRYSR